MRSAILLSAALAAVLTLHFGRAAVAGDFLADHSASADVYHLSVLYERWGDAWAAGRLPIWMDEFAAGCPAPASWMYGLLYPGLALFAVFPPAVAWTWTGILHIVFGSVGMLRLIREHGARVEAAAVGAVLFAFSEFMVGRLSCGHLNLVLPMAWAPWVLLHTIRAVRGAPRAVPWLCVTSALGLMSGHVQVWFYVAPLAGALALAACGDLPRGPVLRRLGGATLLILALTAVQWLPALELVTVSDTTQVSRSVLYATSSPPLHLLSRFVPGALGWRVEAGDLRWHDAPYWPLQGLEHEFLWIGGPWLLLLATIALARPDRLRLFWAGAVLLGVVLGLGSHLPFAEWINDVPPFSLGRTPGRGLVLAVLALPVLGGLGAETWMAAGSARPWRRIVLPLGISLTAVVAASLAIAAALRASGETVAVWPDDTLVAVAELEVHAVLVSAIAAVLGLLLVAGALVFAHPAGARRWLPAVAVGAAAWIVALPPVDTVEPDFHNVDWTQQVPAAQRPHRLHLDDNRFPPVEIHGMRTLREFCHLDMVGFRRLWEPPSSGAAFWFDVGTQAWREWSGPVYAPPEGSTPDELLDSETFATIGAGALFAQPGDAAPLRPGRLVELLQEGTTDAYIAGDEVGRFTRHALTRGVVRRLPSSSALEMRVEVEAPAPSWLVVSEKDYPGWIATVDGRPVAIRRANLVLRAVEIPSGRHEVAFSYRPTSYAFGGAISGIAWLGVLLLLPRRRAERV